MRLFILTIVIFFLIGCGVVKPIVRSESKLGQLRLNQGRDSVLANIGNPSMSRAAKKLDKGSNLYVDEYNLCAPGYSIFNFFAGLPTLTLTWWNPASWQCRDYWLQYVDDKLDRWGRAGDWEPNMVGDITIHQGK